MYDGPIQKYAAVCGNGHIASDYLDQPHAPGSHPKVPQRCKECSAPVFSKCTEEGCNAPIDGALSYPGVVSLGREPKADWFCNKCGVPYVWAEPSQLREWALNQIRFNEELSDEDQDDLLGMVATLTDPEDLDRRATYRSLKERVDALGDTAQSLEPVVRLFRMLSLGE